MLTEWYVRKRPSLLGMVSGAVAGLVAITPAAGYVNPTGAFFIGLFAGPVCYAGVQLKHSLGYDDALDGFGVHAVGGALGGTPPTAPRAGTSWGCSCTALYSQQAGRAW